MLDGPLQHRPVPADGGLRQLTGGVPGAEIPDGDDGLIVVVHAIVLHEGRQERRRVDHPATDPGADTELQRGRELATGQSRPAHSREAADLDGVISRPGGRDRLDVAARGRPVDQSPRELAGSSLEVGIRGRDQLIEHHAKCRRHAAQPSGVGVGVGGWSVC
jgi:hypothetical protein